VKIENDVAGWIDHDTFDRGGGRQGSVNYVVIQNNARLSAGSVAAEGIGDMYILRKSSLVYLQRVKQAERIRQM
jgi:hypothetical protein